MPKRVIDFDAMWASDRLRRCARWARPEYAWLYGLADCNGSFELTNLRVIWGKVAAIRPELTLKRLEAVLAELNRNGLLFLWEQGWKRYGHWTNSERPGRLPRPSRRNGKYERLLAPVVPAKKLAEYLSAPGGCALGASATGSSDKMVSEGDATASTALALALDKDRDREGQTAPPPEADPPGEDALLAYAGKYLKITEEEHAGLVKKFPVLEEAQIRTAYESADGWLGKTGKRWKDQEAGMRNWLLKDIGRAVESGREAQVGRGPTVAAGESVSDYILRKLKEGKLARTEKNLWWADYLLKHGALLEAEKKAVREWLAQGSIQPDSGFAPQAHPPRAERD